jgi:hypothetical protein
VPKHTQAKRHNTAHRPEEDGEEMMSHNRRNNHDDDSNDYEDHSDDNSDDDDTNDEQNIINGILSPPLTDRQRKYIKEHIRQSKRNSNSNKCTDDVERSQDQQQQQQQQATKSATAATDPIGIKRMPRASSYPTFKDIKKDRNKLAVVAKKPASDAVKVPDMDDDLVKIYDKKNLDQAEREKIYEYFNELLRILLKLNPNQNDAATVHNELNQDRYCLIIDHFKQEELKKKELSDRIWLNLYDFFVYYNNRATSMDEIQERLYASRLFCNTIFNNILKLNFNSIQKSMEDDDLITKFKTISDYRLLNESHDYLIKLFYLYCYVEDVLNRVGYCESLYSSIKQLDDENKLYKSHEFKKRYKSLLLWYNIMTMLMRQCDLFGRLFGILFLLF